MKRRNNNLDEMQEAKLLKIEHFGLWIAFWGLVAAVIIQMALGADFKQLAGEWIILMVVCIYLVAACLKNGIWDRHLKPNLKTNLLLSLLAAVVVAATNVIMNLHQGLFYAYLPLNIAIIGGFTFLLCLGALQITVLIYKHRHKELENKEEESGDTLR